MRLFREVKPTPRAQGNTVFEYVDPRDPDQVPSLGDERFTGAANPTPRARGGAALARSRGTCARSARARAWGCGTFLRICAPAQKTSAKNQESIDVNFVCIYKVLIYAYAPTQLDRRICAASAPHLALGDPSFPVAGQNLPILPARSGWPPARVTGDHSSEVVTEQRRLSSQADRRYFPLYLAPALALAIVDQPAIQSRRVRSGKTRSPKKRARGLFQVFEHGMEGAVSLECFDGASRVAAWHLKEARHRLVGCR